MTTNMILISPGGVAGIAVAVAVAVAAVVFSIFFISKNKLVKKTEEHIEFSGDNTKLFEVIDVGNKIKQTSSAIIPPTHYGIIIKNGCITNICESGEYPLCPDTSSKQEIHSLKVIFISKTVKVTIKWGTKLHQRIEYVDPTIGKPVSVGAFGVLDVRVSNPKKFYLELVANFGTVFSTEDLQERIRTLVVDDTFRTIGNVLRENKVSYVDFSTAKYDIQSRAGSYLADKFSESFGFTVSDFIIESINITKEQEDEIKRIYGEDSTFDREKILFDRQLEREEMERQANRRRKEAIKESSELDDYIYNRQKQKEREEIEYNRKLIHEEEDRQWQREDKLLATGERVQNKIFDTYREVENGRSEANKTSLGVAGKQDGNAGHHCSVCGAAYKPDSRYCPGCGAVLPDEKIKIKCPQCSKELSWGTAYCPACGHKIGK